VTRRCVFYPRAVATAVSAGSFATSRRHETRSHDTVLLSHKPSEYHIGYRGFTCQVLKDPPLTHNLDDFLFDNEMLSQAILPRLSHQ
jgi:hypothetical protein